MKPTRSASSAMMAGISSCRNVCRAASMLPRPATAASFTALIFCTPCDTPMAKIRKGTRRPERIYAVAEQHQRAELPRHRDDGADDRHHRHFQRLHVVPDGQQREQDGDDGEDDDRHRAVGDVAHHLGEADHVHVDARALGLHQHVVALDLVAHAAFEVARHFDGIDGFAGGVLLEHDRRHQRAGEIVGHQPAADAGLEDVLAHLGQRFGAWARTPSRPRCRPRCRPRPLPCSARWA